MKKVVQYLELGRCVLGESAVVRPLDHPGPYVTNTMWVVTSPVLKIETCSAGLKFETMNSRYIPAGMEETPPAAQLSAFPPLKRLAPEPYKLVV